MVPPERQAPIWSRWPRASQVNQPDAAASFRKSMELARPTRLGNTGMHSRNITWMPKIRRCGGVLIDPRPRNRRKSAADLARTSMNRNRSCPSALRGHQDESGDLDAVFRSWQLYYSDGKEMDGRTKELLTRYTKRAGRDEAGKREEHAPHHQPPSK